MLNLTLTKRLRDFELDIRISLTKKTLVLIGHSGCGKTTALQLLAGLAAADQGRIELGDVLLFDSETKMNVPAERREVGYVFQSYALFPHLGVADNIAYGIRRLPQDEQRARVRDMLELMQLSPFANERPESLSGGQQQRTALARTLVTRPRLLLLDEPLSALDVSTRGHVRAELKTILDTLSIPCIVVTHDYEDARVLGDEIAVMDRGLIVQQGTPQEIGRMPANRFVARFTGTNLVVEESLATGQGSLQRRQMSFDPWSVTISRTPRGGAFEWSGKVEDKAVLGGYVRLTMQGAVPLIADVAIESEERPMDYGIGDAFCVQVDEAHIRRYEVALQREIAQAELAASQTGEGNTDAGEHTESSPSGASAAWRPKSRLRWLGTPIVAMFLIILTIGIVSGFQLVQASRHDDASHAGTAAAGKELTAFIAANATDPFNNLIRIFEQKHPGVKVQPSYAGTQVIRTQLEQGAKVDIFLAANKKHADEITAEGLVARFYPVSKGHEVIVVPKANPAGIRGLQDLGTKKLKLVIGVDSVPIGQYTRQIFENANTDYGADFSGSALKQTASMETNVKQILEKVALGEGDAGIVYRTDVTPEFADRVDIIPIPDAYNVVATNYAGVPSSANDPELARQLLELMRSPEGQSAFLDLGYDPLPAEDSAD